MKRRRSRGLREATGADRDKKAALGHGRCDVPRSPGLGPTVGRNDPDWRGSGKKFRKCCNARSWLHSRRIARVSENNPLSLWCHVSVC